jgi:uncharacterized protein (TIGR04255 family)
LAWLPIHPTHAIERTRVVIEFSQPIPQKMVSRLGEQFDGISHDFGFGARIETQMQSVMMPPAGAEPIFSQRANGWQFVREQTPGAILEALILEPQGFVYETAEYVRWALFSDRLARMTTDLLQQLQKDVGVRSVALEYFDRFYFDGGITSAVPSALVRTELISALPDSACSGRELWHVHRGWFEGEGAHRYLVNQNVDAQQAKTADDRDVRSALIYTKVERTSDGIEIDLSHLGESLDAMHDVSKRVIRDALIEEMQLRVGLDQ